MSSHLFRYGRRKLSKALTFKESRKLKEQEGCGEMDELMEASSSEDEEVLRRQETTESRSLQQGSNSSGAAERRARSLSSGRLVAGASTQGDVCAQCTWRNGRHTDFKLRVGPKYSKNKRKAQSGPALYEQIGMDVFRNTFDKVTKVSNIGNKVAFEEYEGELDLGDSPAIPRIMIVNVQIPLGAPKMFGKSEPDAGISVVQYFEATEATLKEAQNMDTASPALKLFSKFYQEAAFNDNMARRFKMIGYVHNIAEVGVPAMLHSYNGKPAIVFKTGKTYQGPISGNAHDRYFEMDINVHDFAYVPRKALNSTLDKLPGMKIGSAYVIQGESDDELPETLLGCSDFEDLILSTAQDVVFGPE